MRIIEHRSLIKVKVVPFKDYYTLTWGNTFKVFKGSPEEFAKFLAKIQAKDNLMPASRRHLTYLQIVNNILNGDHYIYVWSTFLK